MLTKRQKSQITALRSEGIGYGTIAQRMQLPKSTVSSFCLRKAMTEATAREKTTVVIPKVEEKEVFSKRKRIVCTVTVTFGT